ncbi:phosphate uptake regulator PhoU [Halalkalicoccus jeotgali]|uniref:ABC transport system regulatory protein n=1 Tax=Halalkalicoccus jeotgali (strain DSM 18796 / CECT 7217 / JCM 14584 / KCTC 4019 / B3) TaxID=795797 RepID=D8J2F5_HALJB|nr:phosphate uptake regulator PhoU [Halalkalicoccus jeotgali]ADJ14912.1 ABC transport system regulatory protein [Halalkalicoccus jeotgali B3]ELY39494.1 ABC transport system regulatory protein [Halalkalicoccus jeotgali B3]
MEVRKVQITGGSTFTVSLPKEWATETGIEAGSELTFYPEGETLVATPVDGASTTGVTLSIEGMAPQELESRIVTLYINGFDEVDVKAEQISGEQRRAVRRTATSLVGFEVSTETTDRIVLQDLLDSSELSLHDTVMQMRLLSLSMLEDAVDGLFEDGPDYAPGIADRDDDVDRLWYVTSRLFRSVLRDPRSAAAINLGRETCFDYRTCARQIERIADHAVKIARHGDDIESLPENVREPLSGLESESRAIVEDAMDAFLVEDHERATELATTTLARATELDERTRTIDERLRTVDPADAQQLGLIVDSLSRIGDYGVNIAETALQKATPTPGTTVAPSPL